MNKPAKSTTRVNERPHPMIVVPNHSTQEDFLIGLADPGHVMWMDAATHTSLPGPPT